jgi:hypothetical protein
MPLFSRVQLRRLLGQNHLRDTYVGSTTASWAQVSYSVNLIDSTTADLAASGQGRHAGAWLRVPSANLTVRVASFNVASGAFVAQGNAVGPGGAVATTPSGMAFEVHNAVAPADKDRAIDEAVKRLRSRREVAIDAVDGLADYPLPDAVEQVLDVYAFASPAATLSRVKTPVRAFAVVGTETGSEVRIDPVLGGGEQLVLDAVVRATLGAADGATIDVPDERLVLLHAEAECWGLLAKDAPRGTADEYLSFQDRATRQYAALARQFKPPVDRPLRIA